MNMTNGLGLDPVGHSAQSDSACPIATVPDHIHTAGTPSWQPSDEGLHTTPEGPFENIVRRDCEDDIGPTTSGDPINILIVDDEPKNLTVLEIVLNDPAYRLVRADSANSALLALLAEEFALLILDIHMPGVSGIELAQMIKKRKKTSRVPIISLTAVFVELHRKQRQLEAANRALVTEVSLRRKAEAQLRELNSTLEQHVA